MFHKSWPATGNDDRKHEGLGPQEIEARDHPGRRREDRESLVLESKS